MSRDANIDPATERALATIEDEELAARYPNRAHFISADNSHQGEMANRALFEGDPVVIVYPEGHELLARQVERTLRHELAHHLGWDERGVGGLGL